MGFRPGLVAAVAAALVCAAPARAVETGVNETLSQTVSTPHKAERLGAQWVRLWALWQDLEPARGAYNQHLINVMGANIAALKARGIKVLVVMHRAPAWASGGRGGHAPPSDPAAFGALHGRARPRGARRRRVGALERAGRAAFWAGGPEPGAYAALLRAAYPAIKAAQPCDVVVTGGMVGNNMDFLQRSTRTARRAPSTRSACTPTPRA